MDTDSKIMVPAFVGSLTLQDENLSKTDTYQLVQEVIFVASC